MNVLRGLCGVGIVVALASGARAADAPAFQHVRYEENAAAYRDVTASGALDRIKYVSLSESDTVYLSLGGQLRARWESWDNFNFAPANDDDFGLFRLRLHGDLRAGPLLRLFVEVKSAEATDRDLPGGRRTLDVDTLDLQNAFADLTGELLGWNATLRLGRQELSYGAQRLVSPLDWSNTRRTWDGARAIFKRDTWRVDAFATRPVIVEKYEFNEWDHDQAFYGVYAVHDVASWNLKYDVYLLRLDRDGLAGGDEERYTPGLRIAGTCPAKILDYDVEGGWQFGDAGERDIEAWFAAAEAGYTFKDCPATPRVHVGYDYASGDKDPADDEAGTFNQLFPLGHAYLGYIDVLGRQNVQAISQGLTFWPVAKRVQVRVDHHFFSRAERADAVYGVGGAVLREADAGTSKEIGTEADVTVMFKVDRHTSAWLGYSRFYAGDFIEESGDSSDVEFLYASVQYTF